MILRQHRIVALAAVGVSALLVLWAAFGGGWGIPPAVLQPPPLAGAEAPREPVAGPGVHDGVSLLATILARPLFHPDRKGTNDTGSRVASSGGLPRLTGIVVDVGQKRAIFQPQGEKPKSLGEGEAIGEWTIQTINRHQIILKKPSGTLTIEPVKDPVAAQAGATTTLNPPGQPMPAPMIPKQAPNAGKAP